MQMKSSGFTLKPLVASLQRHRFVPLYLVALGMSAGQLQAAEVSTTDDSSAAVSAATVSTDSAAAPLAALSHHRLQVRTSNASPFDSYTAAFFLCNALVSAVAQLRHKAVSEALKRRDDLWTDFESQLIVEGPLPTGRRGKR